MDEDKIRRINELARKSRQEALSPEELAEQRRLREEYLRDFRAQFQSTLDHTVIQNPDGTRYPLKALRRPNAPGRGHADDEGDTQK